MRINSKFLILLIVTILSIKSVRAQIDLNAKSPNGVNYKVTYDATTQKYTVWVVPMYSTPNTYNTAQNERGPTAQVSLVVPCQTNILAITDINGIWQKPGSTGWIKLSSTIINNGSSLDPNKCYYIIGKSPAETDYGQFSTGVPVGLFSFTTNGCNGAISLLGPTDPFIPIAIDDNALNVANSFYSLSGQPGDAGGNQIPLEQFVDAIGGAASCSTNAVVTATPENASTLKGVSVTQSVLTNDTYNSTAATTSNVTITIASAPTNGTAVVQSNGSIVYTPNATFTGTDCYSYKICDKTVATNCSTAQNCITVTAPVTNTISAITESATTSFNTAVTVNILSNDVVNGAAATISNVTTTITTNPTNGSVVIQSDGTAKYTPNASFTGTDCFTYQICNKTATSSCASVQDCITVSAAPVTNTISAVTESTTTPNNTAVTLNILSNDLVNGAIATISNVTATITTNPTNGSVVIQSDGTAKYTPNASFTGTDCFTYQICNKTATSSCASVQDCITVSAAPVTNTISAVTESTSTPNNTPITINILSNDLVNGVTANSSSVNTVISSNPTNGTAVIQSDGTVKYTPNSTFVGTDCFTYQICNKTTPTSCSSVQDCITVTAVIPPSGCGCMTITIK